MPKKRPGYGLATWDKQKYPILVRYADTATQAGGIAHSSTTRDTTKYKWPAQEGVGTNKDYYKLLISAKVLGGSIRSMP